MPIDDKYPLALPIGTVLSGQYIIDKVLGQGGFGITYRALDHKNNNQPIALKEYFPDSLVYREMTAVISYPGERRENFEYGKKSFLEEAETLARFLGNKNIVRVYSYFEENGTAYFAMEYIDGIPFDKYLRQKGGRINIDEAKAILIPVMDALGSVHAKGIIHRDVTPDNIYITKSNRVMLLDFGAARYSLGDKSKSLDVVLKHGFAPKEQYSRKGKQGPYTDIYSLGATFYFALTGRRPPDAIDRIERDTLVPPTRLGAILTRYQESAILTALAILPSDRFQSMAEFKNVLLNDKSLPVSHFTSNRPIASPVRPPQLVSQAMGNRISSAQMYASSGSVITPSQQIGSSQKLIPSSQNSAVMNRITPGQAQGMSSRLHTNQGNNTGYSMNNHSVPDNNQPSKEELQRRLNRLKQRQSELEMQIMNQEKASSVMSQTTPINNAAVQQRAAQLRQQQSMIQQQQMAKNAAMQRTAQLQQQKSMLRQQPINPNLQRIPNTNPQVPAQMDVRPIVQNNNGMNRINPSVQPLQNNITPTGTGISSVPNSGQQAISPSAGNQNADFQAPRKFGSKGLIIGIAAVCVVVVTTIAVLVIAFGGSGRSKKPTGSYSTGVYTDYSEPESKSSSSSRIAQTPSKTHTSNSTSGSMTPREKVPVVSQKNVTPSMLPSRPDTDIKNPGYLTENLLIKGTTSDNIKNNGCYTAFGETKFWIDEDSHSLLTNSSGNNYLIRNAQGEFSCLSYTDDRLYYIYDSKAYQTDVDSGSKSELVPSLTEFTNIDQLYVSNDFFFVFQNKKLYRINKKIGAKEESIDIEYGDQITFCGGYLFYISAGSDGNCVVYKVPEYDFKQKNVFIKEENGFFRSPASCDDSLYIFRVRDNEKSSLLTKYNITTGAQEGSWDITSSIGSDEYAIDLNVSGNHAVFTIYNTQKDKHKLYHMLLGAGDKSKPQKITDDNSIYPCITKMSSGNYRVNYMSYDGAKKQFMNRYTIY